MNISINKDIEKYQESVVMGLTARQLIFSIASVACGGAIVLLTYRYVGLTGSAYIAIPVVAPLALNGFYSYQGMSFTQMFKRKLWFAFKNRPLTYISEESEKNIKRMRMEEESDDAFGLQDPDDEEMDDDAFAAEAEAQAAAGIEAEADDSFEDDDDMSDNSDISSLLGNDDEAGYEI